MATTTKKSTNNSLEKLAREFLPIGQQLRRDNYTERHIVDIFKKYVAGRQRRGSEPANPGEIGCSALEKFRSNSQVKVEIYQLLQENGIQFKVRPNIVGSIVDFLINGWLVLDLEQGSDYTRIMDRRLKELGYEILRVPAWLAQACPQAVLDNIVETIAEGG